MQINGDLDPFCQKN